MKLDIEAPKESINDLFENAAAEKKDIQTEAPKKEQLKPQPNKVKKPQKTNGMFTTPIVILMLLIVVLVIVIILILRKKMNKNDDLINDYENQIEELTKELADSKKEINREKNKNKALMETNRELNDKFAEVQNKMDIEFKPKSYKEHKADRFNISNSYSKPKESKLKVEEVIEDPVMNFSKELKERAREMESETIDETQSEMDEEKVNSLLN